MKQQEEATMKSKVKSRALRNVSAKTLVRVEAVEHWASLPAALKRALAFPKEFKAGVVVDSAGAPRYFVFDTGSLWDFLCAVDEQLEAEVPPKAYISRNPVGWLVDAIESHLPLAPKLVAKLKRGIEESRRLGVVPFERVKQQLGLP